MRPIKLLPIALLFFSLTAYGKKKSIPLTPTQAQPGFDHKHTLWNKILNNNVVSIRGPIATEINYKSIVKMNLNQYIFNCLKVKKIDFDRWTKHQQLAFFINLYNALTVQLILKHYPVDSIKDIGSLWRSTWKKNFFTLFGKSSNLDMIEHDYVRGTNKFADPRIHFAFNCASIGCPALSKTAFTADQLEKQLETATINFLSDKKRNYYSSKENTLFVSQIFEWYEGDFEKGWKGYSNIKDFFAKYAQYLTASPAEENLVKSKNFRLSHLTYNWQLNDVRKPKSKKSGK